MLQHSADSSAAQNPMKPHEKEEELENTWKCCLSTELTLLDAASLNMDCSRITAMFASLR